MKNNLTSNIDKELLRQIKNSLFDPDGGHIKNLKEVKEIDWEWNKGKTITTITYADGEVDSRMNDETPPTAASHDVAHFIVALNGNMEWDYLQNVAGQKLHVINHIAEYNAVMVETLFWYLCGTIQWGDQIPFEDQMQKVFDHMKWFAEDYYFISKNHPSKKTYDQLLKDFFEVADLDKMMHCFQIFYELWCIEQSLGNSEFDIKINMGSDLDFYDKRVYDYLYKSKKFLQSLL